MKNNIKCVTIVLTTELVFAAPVAVEYGSVLSMTVQMLKCVPMVKYGVTVRIVRRPVKTCTFHVHVTCVVGKAVFVHKAMFEMLHKTVFLIRSVHVLCMEKAMEKEL